MSYKLVPITENDTGDALVSEIISIPLLMRGEPSTRLSSGHISDSLGLPLLTRDGKPFFGGLVANDKGKASLFHGTILGRFLPELLK